MDSNTRTPVGQYSLAGVVVRARLDDVSQVVAGLAGLAGVEVHHIDAPTGRVVITLETERDDHEEAHLERVRREPGVITAELVYHYVEPQGAV
jgi:nitrate reductase NapD